MASDHSGILDANALFGDLPHFMAPPASSLPPSGGEPWSHPSVAIFQAPLPRHSRRDETTARSQRPSDPTQTRLLAVITCGSIGLAAALAACVVYATTPLAPPAPAATHATR